MMKRLLLLVILLLVGCADSVDYPHNSAAAEALIGTAYAGTATAISGDARAFSLVLNQNGQGELTYKLAVVYVGQSTQPTVRSGRWYSDGETLTLVIEEQDGEPTEQPPLTFQIENRLLTAQGYDIERFDFKPFVLDSENID